MLILLKKWLGFHVHDYTPWKVDKTLSNDYGDIKIIQHRTCKECGYIQVNSQEV